MGVELLPKFLLRCRIVLVVNSLYDHHRLVSPQVKKLRSWKKRLNIQEEVAEANTERVKVLPTQIS